MIDWVCEWLGNDRLPLSRKRQVHIHKPLNAERWRMPYAGIRWLAESQNGVLRRDGDSLSPSAGQAVPMKGSLLVLASVFFCLFLFESGLRTFAGYGWSRSVERSPVTSPLTDALVDAREVMRYVDQLAASPGIDRRWFIEDPPHLPNRMPVSPLRVARYKEFVRRGLFPDQADYIFNQDYVESTRCAPYSIFKNYPDEVLAFVPPVPGNHPFYRFPPNTTAVGGLVTNEFGLRGPPLTLSKPARTIRIAFIGASTTVGFHDFPFSYPERVTYWLNRFAESNRLNVRFEGLNAGREGINSQDIAAITRDELLPLDPDLAIYNGGANQFPSATLLASPHIPPRQRIDPKDPIARHVVPAPIRSHLAIGDLVDRALNGFSTVGEPRKPAYRLNWPHGVNEHNPDVDDPNLPLQLPVIIKDLDSIQSGLKTIGGRLIVSSFEWYANDTIALSPTRHRFIYEQLNTVLWPLRYADIRRLAEFQNRVLHRYAEARGIPFLDITSSIPQEPNLFVDALHLTETGERLKAWIVFQKVAPLIRRQIESGQLPRPAGSHSLPAAPSLEAHEISTRCEDPSGPMTRVAGAVSLETIQAHNDATIQKGSSTKVVTPADRWAFAAELPLHMPGGLSRPQFLYLRGRVVSGSISLGILDYKTHDFQIEKSVSPSAGLIDIYVPVLVPERAASLVIRNAAEGNVRSEMLVQDVALVLPAQLPK